MEKIKIMTVVGTRPEIIRLSKTIQLFDETETVDHCLVHTGQNYDYELNEVFFEDLKLRKPDFFLNAATGTPAETVGHILIKIDEVLQKVKPDAFLILGDTNSCLCAIAAKRHKVPVFHIEAGNRCFDQRVPEETNRKIIDHISDINMTYSDISRECLINEGLKSDRIIKIGSPMYEVLSSQMDKISASNIMAELGLEKNKFFLVSSHREENVNNTDNFIKLVDSINAIADTYGLPIIISTHPRTYNKIMELGVKFHELVKPMKPLGFTDYNKLQTEAKAVLSDSGTISEESAIMNFKALNIRETHERLEAMEEASVMMVGVDKSRILQGLSVLEKQNEFTLEKVSDYMKPNVSEKVLRIIISYIDYIERVVWGK